MGHIGYELFLIVLGACDLFCHIIQTGGQISDLIVTVYLKLVVHVSLGILLGGKRYFTQRHIYDLREKDQDDHRQHHNDGEGDVRDAQQSIAGCLDGTKIAVDGHIPLHHIVRGDGGEHRQHIAAVSVEESVHHVVGSSHGSGIEIVDDDHFFYIQRLLGLQNQTAGRVDNADGGV